VLVKNVKDSTVGNENNSLSENAMLLDKEKIKSTIAATQSEVKNDLLFLFLGILIRNKFVTIINNTGIPK
jgi:hypothetical protein